MSLPHAAPGASSIVFSLTLFSSAGLIFIVEPMIAKMVLPLWGGTPAVWNTCMMFFQAMLLAGYGYAHIISTKLNSRMQMTLQMGIMLLALLIMPIGIMPHQFPGGEDSPIAGIVIILLTSVGLPFFALSALAPLLQKWFAGTGHPSANNPYFLYSASNLGSMIALISYPTLVEPGLGLSEQSRFWLAGYLILCILTLGCAYLTSKSRSNTINRERDAGAHDPSAEVTGVSHRDRLFWTVLAFVPSSLMLGVTTFLTTDIAAVPLFWIVPLCLYLLSFIIVFARNTGALHAVMVRAMPVSLLFIVAAGYLSPATLKWYIFVVHLLNLFIVSMVCHGELVKRRPSPQYLTEFYLYMSLGGVLGGAFNALIAPSLFDSIIEYPMVLCLSALLLPYHGRVMKYVKYLVVGVTLGNLAAGELISQSPGGDIVHRERSFFGVITVKKGPEGRTLRLLHGITVHGEQNLDPAVRGEPTAYYNRQGAMGDLFGSFHNEHRSAKRIAVIGLGVGTLASYGEAGDCFDFYEIDPLVKRIATNPAFFTYLQESKAAWKIIVGDARLKLQRAPAHHYDVIILDAFSSDAIPVHLLTREAIALYFSKLNHNGVVVAHITNKYLNLEPLLSTLAGEMGLASRIRFGLSDNYGLTHATWVALARQEAHLGGLAHHSLWTTLRQQPLTAWTDNFSNIISVFKW